MRYFLDTTSVLSYSICLYGGGKDMEKRNAYEQLVGM